AQPPRVYFPPARDAGRVAPIIHHAGRSGGEVEFDPGLEVAMTAGEGALRRQARGGVPGVPASVAAPQRLDDKMPLSVQVAVRATVRICLQLIAVGPPAEVIIPFGRVRRSTNRPVELIIECV